MEWGKPLNILTIDNERLALECLNNAVLTAEPEARLRTFTRVSEALEAVEKEDYRPDVAFLDIEMPGMTGIELASRIKKASPKTWLIFVTGYSQYALEAFSVHAEGYLQTLITSKNHAFRDVNEGTVVIRNFGTLAVNVSLIDCDYYRFLSMDLMAINLYTGEYMSQYEWGEFTIGYLNQQK